MKKRKKDNSSKWFLYAWAVAFSTGAFLAIYVNRFNGHSKWVLTAVAVILMIAISMLPLSILIGGIRDGYFRYGSQSTYIKFVKKDESPLSYRLCVVGEVFSILAIYIVGITIIIKFIWF